MGNETTSPQAGTTQPQAGTEGSGSAAAAAQNGQVPGSELSAEELRAENERLRKENAETRKEAATYRTKNKDLTQKVETFENEKLTETERIKKKADEAEVALAQAKAEARSAKIEASAVKHNFHDPSDALQIGDAEDIETAVKSLAEKKPWLVKTSETITTTSAGNPTRSTPKPPPAFDPENPPSLADPSIWKK